MRASGFLSTPSARRATRSGWPAGYRLAISIHALREEGDEASKFAAQRTKLFLSTPSARRATNDHNARIKEEQFLSTPSARRATNDHNARIKEEQFLSTPSARRATFLPIHQQGIDGVISIHALREEGDAALDHALAGAIQFLSTPSARRATERQVIRVIDFGISIHALREEGDHKTIQYQPNGKNFYPRPPRGGRQCSHSSRDGTKKFLSTPSARRATALSSLEVSGFSNFYPRPPRGGRPFRSSNSADTEIFLSTPSARRATIYVDKPVPVQDIFLSTPSARRATVIRTSKWAGQQFLSTPSARRATAKTETKSLFSYKLYNILHEFRRALIYNGSKNYPNHAK